VVFIDVHFRRHIFFHHGLKVFSARLAVGICLGKVVHQGLKPYVRISRPLRHHETDHLQNIGAFGIKQPAADIKAGFGVVQAVSHGYRAHINGSLAFFVFIDQDLALGRRIQIGGTPTIIINGALYSRVPTPEEFEDLVQAALK